MARKNWQDRRADLPWFGCEVLAYDPVSAPDWAAGFGIRYVGFDTLLAHGDIVSLHLPLRPQTIHLFNAETFSRMKPGAFW